jgi:hypothetical protein
MTAKDLLPLAQLLYALLPQRAVTGGLGDAARQLSTEAQAGARTPRLQWRNDMAYVQCMSAKGHRVPDAGTPPPPPPGPLRS